jgi:ABC-type polysaccharide/polyol phosphate export permease
MPENTTRAPTPITAARANRGDALLTAARAFVDIFNTNRREFPRSMAMARVDLMKRYSGSSLGIFWALVRPMIFVAVYWFAIAVGIRGGKPMGDDPYIIWLLPGIFPWFFISDSLTTGGSSIRNHKHLVTKMVYPVATIPVFTVISLFFVHLILLGIVLAILLLSGYGLTAYALQLPYYVFCALAFCFVVATLLSTLTAVSRDIEHLVKSTVQVLFWLSPILWSIDRFTGVIRKLIMLNPLAYIIEGYRNALVYERWFYQQPLYFAYFWGFLLVLALVTSFLFAKLQGEFADVL